MDIQQITDRIESAEKELAEAKKELEKAKQEKQKKKGYKGPEMEQEYYYVSFIALGAEASDTTWENTPCDRGFFDWGNVFFDESEAQRVADMLNYFFLLQKKAREMDGLIGYGHDCRNKESQEYVLYSDGNNTLKIQRITFFYEIPPLQPLLTEECAKKLANDPEIIEAAKKAWGVK